jgi:hypothetical protein
LRTCAAAKAEGGRERERERERDGEREGARERERDRERDNAYFRTDPEAIICHLMLSVDQQQRPRYH